MSHGIDESDLTHNALHPGETVTASTSPAQQHGAGGTELASGSGAHGHSWSNNIQQHSTPEIDPELARLEEEERRIDAAIAESERIRALELEKASVADEDFGEAADW